MNLKVGEDFIVISDERGEFTATIGNINKFNDENHITTFEKVLLKNIKDSTGFILTEKEWFDNNKLINIARDNINKEITFKANCKQIVIKGKKKPKLICDFGRLSEIQLKNT